MTPDLERRAGHWVATLDGQTVEVLTRNDLDDVKTVILGHLSRLTRWLIGVGLAAAFSLGFWAASLRSELNNHATAIADVTVNGSRPVQDIRQEMAATREQITALREQLARLQVQLDRRGP